MPLTLTVISYKGDAPSDPVSVTANHEQITVGRHKSNSLVLHDPVVSSRHAVIEYSEGGYYIRDASTNGTLITNQDSHSTQTLSNGQSVKLSNHDLLILGDHEISVSITSQAAQTQEGDDIFGSGYEAPGSGPAQDREINLSADDPFADLGSALDDIGAAPQPMGQASATADDFGDFSFLDAIGKSEPSGPANQPPAVDADDPFADIQAAVMADSKPARSAAAPSESPEGYDDFSFLESLEKTDQMPVADDASSPEPEDPFAEILPDSGTRERPAQEQVYATPETRITTPPPPAASAPGTESDYVQNFLAGAGIANTSVADSINPKSFFLIGQLLSHALQGVIQVLQARSRIKGELGLDVTIIHGQKNNPLKFSPSAQESLIKMLSPQGEAYMPANQAVDEAFNDISAHEMAVMAGMRSALHDVLKRFNPENLEERLQKKSPMSAKIPVHKQAMLWELFQDLYVDIEQEAHDDFDRLFGRAFAKAYNEQLRRNKIKR